MIRKLPSTRSLSVKESLSNLILCYKQCMFLFSRGHVYWLKDHHKHVDPEDAQRILICYGEPPKGLHYRRSNRNVFDKVLYLTEQL